MRFIRSDSKCERCPLQDRTRVWGEGRTNLHLAFYGEAPGREEDADGHPFIGAAGRYFSWGLFESDIKRDQTFISNCYVCRPPGNEFDSFEGQEAQRLCRKGFDQELKYLKDHGVRVLVPMGNNAIHYFGIEGKISDVRGSVYDRYGFCIIPTYHPSFLNRRVLVERKAGPWDTKGTRVDPKFVWLADLSKARRLARDGWTPPKEDFNVKPTLEDLERFVDDVVSQQKLVGVDIETTGFNPEYAHIVVIGLADSDEHAISVPLLQQGGRPYWPNGQQRDVKALLDRLFSNAPLMFQNALFDVPFLMESGYEIKWASVHHDIMLLHHAISPELPHDLGFIVSLYGQTPYWKDDLLKREGSILEMDNKQLRTYNLRDCVVLHQCLPSMLVDLREIGTEEIYYNESIKLLKPVGKMKLNGVKLNAHRLRIYKSSLARKLEQIDSRLRENGSLPDSFNLNSDDDLRLFLFNEQPGKFSRLVELQEYDPSTVTRVDKRTGEKRPPLKKNTDKYRDLIALRSLRDNTRPIYLPMGYSGRKTKKGRKRKVDEQGRLSLQVTIQNRLREIRHFKRLSSKHELELNQIERLLDWLELFNEYASVEKLLSTYTSYPVASDGRVHSSFLIHGTATGRLSSSKPNMQNLPKKEIAARKPFVADEGFVLLSADYNNLEVRVLAYESEDDVLIKQLESGINIHDENTKTLFGIDPENELWPEGRKGAKTFQFGGIQYGGSDREIYEKVILDAPRLRLTFKEFIEAKERYNVIHPKYRLWYETIERGIRQDGVRTARTFHGRVRFLMGSDKDILKQALNTPIQGGAGGVINRAMIRIDDLMDERKLESRIVLQIHDQLVYEVPNSELEEMKLLVKTEMERPVDFKGTEVIFPVDLSTGLSLGELKDATT